MLKSLLQFELNFVFPYFLVFCSVCLNVQSYIQYTDVFQDWFFFFLYIVQHFGQSGYIDIFQLDLVINKNSGKKTKQKQGSGTEQGE